MKRYVFLGNSSKPTKEEYESTEMRKLSNVSRPCLETAHDLGYEVYLGINCKYPEKITTDLPFDVKLYNSNTYRSILSFKDNKIAYKNLINLLSKGDFEVIHCNTPIGGMIGRLCGKKKKIKKVIYTAHGFHFYKGAPLFNNTILKLAERIMAHWTDAIITMNQEDYEAAKKFKLKKYGKVYFVHGVGIDIEDFKNVKINVKNKRKELNIKDDDIVLISVGDVVQRKNYSLALDVIAKCNNPKLKYLICGLGPEMENLKNKAKSLGIENQIMFLGFRKDIKELLKISNIFLFTTTQEGLPRSLMEAMASGLPCIVSKIRGNVDLIENDKGGFCCDTIDEYVQAINTIIKSKNKVKKYIDHNLKIIKQYDIENVKREIKQIYKDVLVGDN